MKRLFLVAVLISISACASQAQTAEQTPEARGQALVETNCGSCHATGPAGESPAPEAPPFRTLSQNYRVADLEEALAEGISVGHPAMPQFQFEPEDVNAIIVYLQSIQTQPPPAE
ncbi:MAG TPA: cytochrome c [Vitreimonas sp.]|uniref:c-type cytochrome n=1 Tax=Vitreimonas sp. TaxID=3069702 RepID=UPI002D5F648D|nr:cytochrome c [Vitreimonas sp.]HYD88907.1 cytochrome c [Vitreimonas sp.]